MITEKKGEFSIKIRVRFNECDPSGYAFNANFFIWMQEGIGEYFKTAGIDLVQLAISNQTFMAVHLSCDYKRPVGFQEVVEIRPFLKELRDSTIHIQHDLYRENKLVAVGHTIYAYIDLKTKKKIPLPDDLKNKFTVLVPK